ncbi:alkylated DNA repair dioxygenase AlkB [Sphingomonas sp. PP-CE-3A-406]|uniref:alpha-ketoglutarate-dependent dioxygenase AlkB family protein n=1 Tax=Sphingomonas sp. PP-CE-3A-406 TaxID=2135659 RepID=UPI000EF8FA92|nr:alpha-ketoglutarate-dependent dioxygenase AlkB [Sphingomonas sp. PP-CE-3A-406]RMB55775.1 alkylated DNA repair dioxygenase AlkB [Sphingomonas sp. PP-CE-3A-406]
MRDLFSSDLKMSSIPMEDADVSFLVQFPMPLSNDSIFEKLNSETKWLHEEIVVWGKRHLQPRLTAWYGDPGRSYTYSGTVMFPMPWTNLLLSIKRELESIVDARFNSVLLNLYRDNNDSMGFHSDNEPSLGKEPTIASLSYGATRTLLFKHKKKVDLPVKAISLTSGSMMLMQGPTQSFWKHGINKESKRCDSRINLTFRNILK